MLTPIYSTISFEEKPSAASCDTSFEESEEIDGE